MIDIKAMFDISYGVYIVSSLDDLRPVGCIVNTVFQITANPMTVAISVNKDNYTEDCIRKNGHFAVSTISEKTPQSIIGTFGFQSSRDTNKFEGLKSRTVQNDLHVITEETCSYITCKVLKEVNTLTHTIFIGEVIEAEKLTENPPMTYAYYHKVKGGKTAKNAPTYVAEDIKDGYVCNICGYKFDGTKEDLENLPEDWKCPICGQDKS
ncbi:MAG: flavin reductase, partial [Oscillospiraceae bacterium]